jgi:predicted RNA polymerase sigma factor
LVAALKTWPRDGVPQNPEAWLLTTARHSFIDLVRHQRVAQVSEPTLQLLRDNFEKTPLSMEFPDERMKLLFVCAHPAIEPAMHTPLMLHCEARRAARRGRDGRYVPLSEQDPKLWSFFLIEEAERHLAEASKYGRPGRFQLEAAIQSVHAERARSGRVEWTAIVRFYEQLEPHMADARQANWIRSRACGGEWSGRGTSSSGCNQTGRSLCLSTLLGGSRSSPAASWERFRSP